MDLFQHRYYRLSKILLKLTGLWPYQSVRVRVVIIAVLNCVGASILLPQLIAVVKHLDDRDFIVECARSLIICGLCWVQGITAVFNFRKMLQLLNYMRTDWKVWGRDCDVDILHEYAEKGRKMTIVYTVMLTTTCSIALAQPVIPKIIDILLKNGTQLGQFPVPLDYNYIDMQKYYFYIVVHCVVCTYVGFLVGTACDIIFMIYVQHSCGLFAILRRKLQRLGKNQISAFSEHIPYGSDKLLMAFEYLSWCIDKHNHAIQFAELIDATYSWCFLFVAALNMLLISIQGIQFIERTNELEITMKLICCIAMAMVHLYFESYMGQIVMDHSISIRDYIFNGEWYVLPLKAQKLLPLMMMRSSIPCKLTVAKLTVMSVETFGVILKTSLSYFTLLRSV